MFKIRPGVKQTEVCSVCEGPISKDRQRRWAKFCSKNCSRKFNTQKYPNMYPGLSPSSIGAIHELLVAADLLKRGYQVYRALSPSCDADLSIVKSGILLRVEVRTGGRKRNGKISYKKHSKHLGSKFDLRAIYIKREGKIFYTPSLKKLMKRAKKEAELSNV